jgi:hypothetical protein
MVRPSFSAGNFLAHIFSPKRHAKPSGLRKTALSGLRGGRLKNRLASFNRMDAVKQHVLQESGQREAYLRGEVTFAEAKRSLRPKAIQLGVAKPVRPRGPVVQPVTASRPMTRKEQIEARMAYHLKSVIARAGKRFNPLTIEKNVRLIPEYAQTMVFEMEYPEVAVAASPGSPFEFQRVEDNARWNPFWYN